MGTPADHTGDFEARAGRIVARATGLKTVLQDDNRALATPELRLEDAGVVVAVGEIVTTTSGPSAAQLRAFARGELDSKSDELTCTWWVTVDPSANATACGRILCHYSPGWRPTEITLTSPDRCTPPSPNRNSAVSELWASPRRSVIPVRGGDAGG